MLKMVSNCVNGDGLGTENCGKACDQCGRSPIDMKISLW